MAVPGRSLTPREEAEGGKSAEKADSGHTFKRAGAQGWGSPGEAHGPASEPRPPPGASGAGGLAWVAWAPPSRRPCLGRPSVVGWGGGPDLGTPVQTTPRCPRKPTRAPPTPPRSDTEGGLQPGCKSVPRPPPPPWTGLPYDLHAAGAVRTAAPQRSGRGSGGPQQRLACMLRWWVWGAGQARPWRPAAWSNISLDAPFVRGWASPNQSTASREKREVSWRGNSTSRRWHRDPARGPYLPTCLMGFRSAPQSSSLKEGRDR